MLEVLSIEEHMTVEIWTKALTEKSSPIKK